MEFNWLQFIVAFIISYGGGMLILGYATKHYWPLWKCLVVTVGYTVILILICLTLGS